MVTSSIAPDLVSIPFTRPILWQYTLSSIQIQYTIYVLQFTIENKLKETESTEDQESESLEESAEEPMTQTSTEIVSCPIREIEAAALAHEEMDLSTQLASLSRIVESRQRRHEEIEESGHDMPLDIPSMRDSRRWPSDHRALVTLLEDYGIFRPNNNFILESRFEDSGNNFNITQRTEEGYHTLTLYGPRLRVLG